MALNLASGCAESYATDGVGYIFASARKIYGLKHPVTSINAIISFFEYSGKCNNYIT